MTSRHEAYIHEQLEPDTPTRHLGAFRHRKRTQDIAREEWERMAANDPEGAADFLANEQRKRVWDAAREQQENNQ